jgi:hypothetical protein
MRATAYPYLGRDDLKFKGVIEVHTHTQPLSSSFLSAPVPLSIGVLLPKIVSWAPHGSATLKTRNVRRFLICQCALSLSLYLIPLFRCSERIPNRVSEQDVHGVRLLACGEAGMGQHP